MKTIPWRVIGNLLAVAFVGWLLWSMYNGVKERAYAAGEASKQAEWDRVTIEALRAAQAAADASAGATDAARADAKTLQSTAKADRTQAVEKIRREYVQVPTAAPPAPAPDGVRNEISGLIGRIAAAKD